MIGTGPSKPMPMPKREAAMLLSKLIEGSIGVFIDPESIRILFRDRWLKLSLLAHAIHEGVDDVEGPDAESRRTARDA